MNFASSSLINFFFQAEDGIRDRSPSRGLGDVYNRQVQTIEEIITKKRMGTNNPAFKNLRVLGKESQAEVK